MKQDRIAQTSQRMASLTMLLLVAILVFNIGGWLFPDTLNQVLEFSNAGTKLGIDISTLPPWQLLGAIVLTNIPLLALGYGLFQLRALFRRYALGEYFSPAAAIHLGRVGHGIAWWVLLDFLCGPLSSVWLTITRPAGQRLLNIGFDGNAIVALFMAACITVIARILQRASEVDAENRQFV
ncbi:DUF2975 domain-containing protein [Collimonas fungivorans]|uniref:DUF2975 domain-containing protein n=1 Tax=Collimonas fungivorans (strain Ter331) TaxID=1005048 RepID=G0AAE8_COLFT|nr:DUF2975 domain-containing protein [Collimonas fungivorans]AEK63162.1 hypothetical protein CFU_3338 [Collimonas fungivorans Ter331]